MSVYKIVKMLGLPQSSYSRLAMKIKGFANMQPRELEKICEVVSAFSGRALLLEEIETTPVWIRVVPEIQDSADVAQAVAEDKTKILDEGFKEEKGDLV